MTITYKNYNDIQLPIPCQYERIGIAMSGGLDSTLLAMLLLPLLDHNAVTVYTVDLKNSVQTVQAILKNMNARVAHVVLPDPKNPNGALSPSFLEICNEVDYFYTGITMNPPWADAIPDGQKPHRFNKVQYQNMFMPFGTATKDVLVDLFISNDKQNLLEMTHTCTERPHGDKSCGQCFACRERIWAFEQTDYFDLVAYE